MANISYGHYIFLLKLIIQFCKCTHILVQSLLAMGIQSQ
jgi:hypothetical protein